MLTGLAGVVTAVVTLVSLAVSQGWVGDGETDSGGTGDESAPSASVPVIEVEPTSLSLKEVPLAPGDPSDVVTVTNEGTEPFSMGAPTVTGDEAEGFEVDSECPAELPSGLSCDVTVTFTGRGQAEATLVFNVNDGQRFAEVDLKGTAVV